MSTFYAAFPDTALARGMVWDLLEDGIGLDDISLIVHEVGPDGETPLGDASEFIGRKDDPPHDVADDRRPEANFVITQGSKVGGGVSTAEISTDVESIDQMDDGQDVAEDLTWPPDEPEPGRDPLDDLDRSMMTVESIPANTEDEAYAENPEEERGLEEIPLDGVGAVIGGGELATMALGWKDGGRDLDPALFLTYLQDEGVPPTDANLLYAEFEGGGALLAVALTPELDEDALQGIAENHGAVASGWYGAPRY